MAIAAAASSSSTMSHEEISSSNNTHNKNNNNDDNNDNCSDDQHEHDVVMPGFRFHPTEEELVEFYLRRKVEGKRFNVELITFVDLYRYDPWELPGILIFFSFNSKPYSSISLLIHSIFWILIYV